MPSVKKIMQQNHFAFFFFGVYFFPDSLYWRFRKDNTANIEKNPKEWKEFIEAPDNPDEIKGIKEKTRTGRPLGSNYFVERLEGQLKRVFKLKPKGRPKKKVDK